MGRITDPDLGSMRILHLPHSWNHCMGDHMIVFTVWPISAQETMVTTKWLVHKDAVEGVDYDVARLRQVWDATNDQDRRLAEENQRGINSTAYQPGPYSKTYEFGVVNFIDWYSERLLNNLGAAPAPYLKGVAAEYRSWRVGRPPERLHTQAFMAALLPAVCCGHFFSPANVRHYLRTSVTAQPATGTQTSSSTPEW